MLEYSFNISLVGEVLKAFSIDVLVIYASAYPSTLSKLIESDYNSKECKLLLADLCEMLLEQLKEEKNE